MNMLNFKRDSTPADPTSLSPGDLADELGEIKARVSELTEREAALKEAARGLGVDEFEGARFRVTVSRVTSKRLDMAKVRKKLGELWCKRNSNTTTTTKVNVVARKRLT